MTETEILAATYTDVCSVYHPQKVTLPSGESVFLKGLEGKLLYISVPCALSKAGGGKLNRTQTTAKVTTEYCLFVRPEIDIQPNDTVVVSHLGKVTVMVAGLADRQPSHNNVPLKPMKEDA